MKRKPAACMKRSVPDRCEATLHSRRLLHYDALKDLADALGIADGDISLGGNLSIAFGARGQGLSGAAAHYERERHVINLTKMNGAGSLAHEWFHALDDFAGGYGNLMSTDNLRALPERTREAMRALLSTMQYRDATQEETDMAATKRYEQARRSVEYQVEAQFRWVEKVENGTLTDSDTRYYARKPTEADAKRYHELLDKLLATGDASVVDELSALRKAVNGHVIAKENREAIGYRLGALTPSETQKVQKMRLRSDYYNGSRRFGELHQKDGDYWDSTVEMAARAFACYVADKTNAQNDYLSAHSDSAATLDVDKKGNPVIVKAFPEGQERKDINRAFDELIAAMKADGVLHERGEMVKPDTVQYQARKYLEEDSYPTNGVHWGLESGIITKKDAAIIWNAIANIEKLGYHDNKQTENGEYFIESDNNLFIVDTNYRNPVVRTIFKFNDTYETSMEYAKELITSAKGDESDTRKASAFIEEVYGHGYVTRFNVGADSTYAGQNRRGEGKNSGRVTGTTGSTERRREWRFNEDGELEQNQQRTNTLTDREVLAMAADQVKIDDLNAAEQDALRIFRERLEKLEKLRLDRAEQGRLYKEQQFGAKVDREAAAKTLNRMHVLDEQIKRASADVLAVEETAVLGQVLRERARSSSRLRTS